MPTTSWILLAFILGSAAGAAGERVVSLVVGGACLLIATRLRRAGRLVMVAAPLLAVAAAGRATAERWHDAHCRSVIVRSPTVELVADFDLHPGDAGPALLRDARRECAQAALVRARTALRGGQWYRTGSRAEPGTRGLQLTVRVATPIAERALRPALRAAGVRRVDSIFTVDVAMARALLLADMHLIAPEMRRRWARSGLVHLLSVSGVHVAIIASALLLLGTTLRLSQRQATIVALLVTAGYVVILGLPPPAVRAAVMFGSVLLAKLRQRPASEWSVLLIGATLPVLVDPAAPLDLGWQLSVLGVAALAASGRLVRRLHWHGGGRVQVVRREFVASVVASVASAPILAWYFGTVSLVAPFANLLAAPLVTVLQPTLFLALLCAPCPALARFVADAAHPVLVLLDGIAEQAARPSWAAMELAPALTEALLSGAVVLALLVAMIQRDVALPVLVAAGCGVLLTWHAVLPSRGSGMMELHMLDVGQGDALAVRTPRGGWVVIDAGGGAPGLDRGKRTVLPHIRRLGGPVHAFILSHPHLDHVGGAPAVIGAMRPARYLDGAFAGGTESYRASLESAAVHRVSWSRVHPGDTVQLEGVTFRFLAPDSGWTATLRDANLASTVVRVEFGRTAMLLTGDAELAEESWLLGNVPPEWLRADVLKVGHHGSRTSSGPAFLDAVQPALALVSVGRGNSYGHPSPDVLQALALRQITVVRTDLAGTIVVRSDGHAITVSTAARQWLLPSPDSATGSALPSSSP
ncbi:MAG: DNA internalization-related competence protein ComEC/Rec2 [Gemmatimonadota bacterium]